MPKIPINQYRFATLKSNTDNIPLAIRQMLKEGKGSAFVCEFSLQTGFINVTESGYKPNNAVPQDYGDFQKILTGENPVIAQWTDACEITINDGVENQNYMNKAYKVGKFKNGILNLESGGTLISNDPTDIFKSIQSDTNIEVYFDEPLTEEDKFKFYIIPIDHGTPAPIGYYNDDTQWLYLAEYQNYVDPKNNKGFAYSRAVFSSVNNKISSSGQAVWSYIYHGGPGEGYAWPAIRTHAGIPELVIDDARTHDTGVKTMQIEFLGPAALGGITIFGRPLKKANLFTDRIYPSRALVPYEMLPPNIDPLTINTAPTTTFYFASCEFSIDSYYKDYAQNVQAVSNETITKKYEGHLRTKDSQVDGTNPQVGGARKVYWDQTWIMDPLSFPADVYDIRPNGYFVYRSGDVQFGDSTFNYQSLSGKDSSFANLLAISGFIQMMTPKLPVQIRETTLWSLKTIPIIGNFLNALTLSYPIFWKQVKKDINANLPFVNNIGMFMPSNLYDWTTKTLYNVESDNGLMPLDIFRNGTENTLQQLYNNDTTTFTFTLTDKVVANQWMGNDSSAVDTGGWLVNTLLLGQNSPDILSKYIVPLIGSDFTRVDPKDTNPIRDYPVDWDGDHYVIDAISIKSLSATDIRISFYNDDTSIIDPNQSMVWQGTFKSFSKFTNNLRSWDTEIKLSYLDLYIKDDSKFRYPAPISEPLPQTSTDLIINVLPSGHQINQDVGTWEGAIVHVPQYYAQNWSWDDEKVQLTLFDCKDYGFSTWNDFKNAYPNFTMKNLAIDFYLRVDSVEGKFNKSDRLILPDSQISTDISDAFWTTMINYNFDGEFSPSQMLVVGYKDYPIAPKDWSPPTTFAHIAFRVIGTKLVMSINCSIICGPVNNIGNQSYDITYIPIVATFRFEKA